MPTNDDIEYLRVCLKHTSKQHGEYPKGSPFLKRLWWGEEETVSEVARILIENCVLDTPESAMLFYDKPHNFEKEMQEIVDNANLNK